MIVAPGRFVFLHVPKTGGTWATHVLRSGCPRRWRVRARAPKHCRWRDLPGSAKRLPAFAFVRHPLGYYESWHAFHRRVYHDHDFADGLGHSMFRPDNQRAVWWANHFESGGDFATALPYMVGEESWTGQVLSVVTDDDGKIVCSTYRYEDGLPSGLLRAVVAATNDDAPRSLVDAAMDTPTMWASDGEQVEWSEGMVGLVRSRDGDLAARLGYDVGRYDRLEGR